MRAFRVLWLLIFQILVPIQAMSVMSPDLILNQQTTTVVQTPSLLNKNQDKKNNISILLEQQAYAQFSELAADTVQVFALEHKYNYVSSTNQRSHKFQSDLILGGYSNNNSVYIAVPEIYYEYLVDANEKQGLRQSFSVGRRILESSQIDQNFNLGLTNAYLTQDFLNYQKQGLMGLHQMAAQKYWSINLSVLPIYLPNQGPGVKEYKGKIIGSNRWVKGPPTEFAFNDSNKEIIYSVNYDEITKLIATPGAHAQVKIGAEDGLQLVSSFSKRPMNEPVLERETFADLDVVGRVNLVPNVIYNELLTLDLKLNKQNFKAAVSYVADRPDNKIAKEFHSIQNLSGITGVSLSAEYSSSLFNQREISVGAAIAEFQGGEITDINSDGTENIFTFSKQRLQYKKPFQIFLNSDVLAVSGRQLKAQMKWIYDREQKGSVLMSQISLQASRSLKAHLGVDLLGVEEQKSTDYGFLQQYQSNDRFYGGLEYVF